MQSHNQMWAVLFIGYFQLLGICPVCVFYLWSGLLFQLYNVWIRCMSLRWIMNIQCLFYLEGHRAQQCACLTDTTSSNPRVGVCCCGRRLASCVPNGQLATGPPEPSWPSISRLQWSVDKWILASWIALSLDLRVEVDSCGWIAHVINPVFILFTMWCSTRHCGLVNLKARNCV